MMAFVSSIADENENTVVSHRFRTGCGRKRWYEMFTQSSTMLCSEDRYALDEDLYVRRIIDEVTGG